MNAEIHVRNMSNLSATSKQDFRLRIVSSGEKKQIGLEIQINDGMVTIGRDASCTIVLKDLSISRKHAQLQITLDGLKLSDMGSENGVWIGSERVQGQIIQPGQQFRVGTTVFEIIGDVVPELDTNDSPKPEIPKVDQDKTYAIDVSNLAKSLPSLAPEDSTVTGFIVKIVEFGKKGALSTREVLVRTTVATIGRGEDCTIVLDRTDVSRIHAKIELCPEGFRVTDTGSTNGIWIGTRAINEEIIPAETKLRVGRTVELTCHLFNESGKNEPEGYPAVQDELGDESSQTIFMPVLANEVQQRKWLEQEGTLVEVKGNEPFLLANANYIWYLIEGDIDIFTVAVTEGKPQGARTHFLRILPGQCFFGLDPRRFGMESGFLVVGSQGTQLRRIEMNHLKTLATTPTSAKGVASLLDTWISGLSKSLVRDLTQQVSASVDLEVGVQATLDSKQKARSAEGLVWVNVFSGSLLFNDMATPVFKGTELPFPLSPESWLQPVSDEFDDAIFRPVSTLEALRQPKFWEGLDVFHQVLCEIEFINKRLAAVDEYLRLQQKAAYSKRAAEAAYDAIGSVLSTESEGTGEFLELSDTAPLLRACKLVGASLDLEVQTLPGTSDRMTFVEHLAAIASASGFRTRTVVLRAEWWKEDNGPLLAQLEETGTPVAILPTSARSSEYVDTKTGTRGKVDETFSARLNGFAQTFYRPFPDGQLSAFDVIRFGARGLKIDLRLLILMGIIVGIFGTATPYLTGRIFDAAIPQADRGMLFAFGFALFGTALATSLFKFTQGIATVRLQGKMEYSIQSALWDRLLNLPANFFRKYSAGDLSDRVNGVDAIQNLVSGAGIAAVLGSFSGLFYVVLMFTYNIRLALLAIALTLVFVGTTMLANYLQLRHQRNEIAMRGRITGLVLNLITGVTKLRICGAEHHAFRVWAQNFAQQRRISFAVGTIQNMVSVFNAVFPIISSMGIFAMMIYEQQQAAETGQPGLTIGDFIAFTGAYGAFLGAMQSLGDASLNLLRVVPIYERLKPILVTTPEVDSSKSYPGRLEGEIELSQVFFRYVKDGAWIVKDLSLKINPGEFVAFVGESGCGKSTIMRLMLGFEQPAMGSIYFDAQDLSSLDARMLRQQMGVVLQVSRVLPTDVYRNIVGVSSRTMEEAWAAAEQAGLAEDIRAMPMGMHTYVSEGGGTLSGGQRQRLLIARSIVNKPKILFLDEATSALDNRAQAIVTESMDKLDATRIVIAHRLSTIINANKICYLQEGEIVEMGTYQELMDQGGRFAALARRQMA